MDKTYKCSWTKTYIRHSDLVIQAASKEEAYKKLDEKLGNLTGSLQYLPDENTILIEKIRNVN